MGFVRKHLATLLPVTISLAGCASHHVIPPANYSAVDSVDLPVLRIAFDQDGNIYPPDPNDLGLQVPSQARSGDSYFNLKAFYAEAGPAYDPARLTAGVSSRIASALAAAGGSRLVVLIHGFNNSYVDASAQYEALRAVIKAEDPTIRHVYLQVYWDGLLRGGGTAPAPLSYFGKALTYSNLAGMCGLRRVMAGLPRGTDVTFVTHSRGAAVALSAATNPLLDDGIVGCSAPDRPTVSNPGDVTLVAYAPAVGDEHMRDEALEPVRAHYDYFDRIYVGFNRNDPATAKRYLGVRVGGRRGGDTRLGSEPGYIDLIAGASDGRMQYVAFTQRYHGWGTYLAEEDRSKCMLWAGRLIRSKPDGCELTR